jgi:hypothetical protein
LCYLVSHNPSYIPQSLNFEHSSFTVLDIFRTL